MRTLYVQKIILHSDRHDKMLPQVFTALFQVVKTHHTDCSWWPAGYQLACMFCTWVRKKHTVVRFTLASKWWAGLCCFCWSSLIRILTFKCCSWQYKVLLCSAWLWRCQLVEEEKAWAEKHKEKTAWMGEIQPQSSFFTLCLYHGFNRQSVNQTTTTEQWCVSVLKK